MNIRSRSTVIDELALIASMWFADHLRNSTQSSVGDKDGDLAIRFSTMLSPPATAQQIKVFEDTMFKSIVDYFRENTNPMLTLDVDYSPDLRLSAALKASGIRQQLPIKTMLHIDAERATIRTKSGYGAPFIQIWPTP